MSLDVPLTEPKLLNIQQVADATGLTTSVLRIWELRYGWPRPTRNVLNGYRMYKPYMVEELLRMKALCAGGQLVSRFIRDGVPQWPAPGEVIDPAVTPVVIPPLKDEVAAKLRAAGAEITDANRMRWAQLVMGRSVPWIVAMTAQAALRSRRRLVGPEDADQLVNPRRATVWVHPPAMVPLTAENVETAVAQFREEASEVLAQATSLLQEIAVTPPVAVVRTAVQEELALAEEDMRRRAAQDAAEAFESPPPDRLSTPPSGALLVPRSERCYDGVLKRYLAVLAAAREPIAATEVAVQLKCGQAAALRYLKRNRGLLHVTYGLYNALTVSLNEAGRRRCRELGVHIREPTTPEVKIPVLEEPPIVVPAALPPEPDPPVEAEVPVADVLEDLKSFPEPPMQYERPPPNPPMSAAVALPPAEPIAYTSIPTEVLQKLVDAIEQHRICSEAYDALPPYRARDRAYRVASTTGMNRITAADRIAKDALRDLISYLRYTPGIRPKSLPGLLPAELSSLQDVGVSDKRGPEVPE